MKAYKKIISFILTLVMMLSLSVNVFAAEPLTDDPNMIEWKYTVFANEIGYVYCDDRVAFVLNIFLERFVNDTVDYHIHYVGVDSLDEECIECRKYSDYCEHILPAFWIDDDFCE